MRLPAPIANLAASIDARDRRERLLLGATVLVVLLLVWDMLLRAPLMERHADAVDRAQQIESEIASLRDSRESLQARLAEVSQEESGRSPAARLRQRVQKVDEKLAGRTAQLISPAQMVGALKDVVAGHPGIRLVRLENQAPETILDASADASNSGSDVPRVYRHSVDLVIEGRYLDVLEYVRRLEALEWQFQWDDLQLETTDYPKARASLTLSTLSLAEDWIGV